MKKRNILFCCFTLLSCIIYSQSATNDAAVNKKMSAAKEKYDKGFYEGALALYQEANTAKPNDAIVLYCMGECENALENYDDAVGYLQRAENIDTNVAPDLHLLFYEVAMNNNMLDKALKEITWYKQEYSYNPKQLKDNAIDKKIAQVQLAISMEGHPVNVNITNLGDSINTPSNEKAPSVSADGRTMIFTSDRSLLVGDMKQSKDPNYVFDNVYIAYWDSAANGWGLSEPIPGDVNQPYTHTACTSISPDGNYIFLFRNPKNGAASGGDIFISKKSKKGTWGAAVSMGHPVNSSYYEDGACLSPDGSTLYFVSERPGGYGSGDIYKSDKISRTEWSEPVNLGPVVNSEDDEGAPFIAADGRTLFFSSNGHHSMGGYDIFITILTDTGKWTVPANLGYPINSVNDDKNFTLSADARTGYFSSNRKGGIGKRDIYMVDLSQHPLLASETGSAKPKGFSILRGQISNAKGEPQADAPVIVTDSAGTKVASLKSNVDGQYFITLKANAVYKLKVSVRGYKTFSKQVKLPSSPFGTYTLNQDVLLEKE